MNVHLVLLAGLGLLLLMSVKRSDAKALIKRFEGFSPVPYIDESRRTHIGYGHLVKPGEVFESISRIEGERLLALDMVSAYECVNRHVTVPLKPYQRDALVSFVYNVGCGAFEGSTLLRKLNAGDVAGAASEFLRWNKAGGEVVQGLVDRRFIERDVFLGKG